MNNETRMIKEKEKCAEIFRDHFDRLKLDPAEGEKIINGILTYIDDPSNKVSIEIDDAKLAPGQGKAVKGLLSRILGRAKKEFDKEYELITYRNSLI